MEWHIVGLNILYAAVGVIMMYIGFRIIDHLTTKVSLEEELKKGNIAVGIMVGSLFLAIAIIIAGALS